MRFSVSAKIVVANLLIVSLLFLTTAIIVWSASQQKQQVATAAAAAGRMAEKALPLVQAAKSLNINIIQIQQWLTDISATRGRDGLDDGFRNAEAARAGALKDLATSLSLARDLGQPELEAELAAVGKALEPFYVNGVAMAKAYIDEGTEAGNRRMVTLDADTELLSEALDGVVARVDRLVLEARQVLKGELTAAEGLADHMVSLALGLTAAALVVSLAISLVLHRRVSNPLVRMTAALQKIGEGDASVPVPSAGNRNDEIADMAGALLVLRDRTQENKRLRDEQAAAEGAAAENRRRVVLQMADLIRTACDTAVRKVSGDVRQLDSSAGAMLASADTVSRNSHDVAAAAEQALANIQAVAGATEELSVSIRDIGSRVDQAMTTSRQAVKESETTRDIIDGLSQTVSQIGEVAGLIGSIAAQTNLLALNATIEAARAGEAGKGFAVVASEVKNLANQTARSTEEITRRIGEIQAETAHAVQAVGRIGSSIQAMDAISASIAAAMEQQSGATQAISMNIHETAGAAREVAQRIAEVSSEARDSGEQANVVREVAENVTGGVSVLQQTLEKALGDVTRAA